MADTTTTQLPAGHSGWLHDRFVTLMHELAKFGTVGGIAFVVDTGTFNLIRHLAPYIFGDEKPVTAKIISVAVATVVAWVGNRHWTYKDRGALPAAKEFQVFAVMNVIGMAIMVGCLWFSHYVLGFTSALADNISGNGVGLVLSTLFRFVAYRTWVFPPEKAPAIDLRDDAPEQELDERMVSAA